MTSYDDPIDADRFGPLADIPESSLLHLGSRIASNVLKLSNSEPKLLHRLGGPFNIVHILSFNNDTTRFIIRVPATGWGKGLTPAADKALEAQVSALKFIKSQKDAKIPVPEVYDWDSTCNNEINAPYICLSYLPGKQVLRVWTDDNGPMPKEHMRLRILTSLTNVMAEFAKLPSFDRLGSLFLDDNGNVTIGPVYRREEDPDGPVTIHECGIYTSGQEYLRTMMERDSQDNHWGQAESKITSTLISLLPKPDSEDFVLAPPDFDSANILVNPDTGEVTGLIEWDLTHTKPRWLGYSAYPYFLTRDWDPLMYGWPNISSEDSPEALAAYRAHYSSELGRALGRQGDWVFTDKSHLTMAVWISTLNPANRLEICQKFLTEAWEGKVDALSVVWEIGKEKYGEEEWEVLKKKLRTFLAEGSKRHPGKSEGKGYEEKDKDKNEEK
ncbi:uncharacterized protein CTHT_0039530 [Thermochaetoides thermophila DSM 1495]|uniref:Aminoglycoside phosphotransferase domain-containing protein n=1 Tax=Chaetomium thermophilum (strain DSM 1495 / CBS 144.50 / IMI 039719) TaxID=759272 RepID=G0S4B0_CHATD|nr:hypothetical protein CTHT_0039530 [Thermochaetoides thermophila DSM 1495]EGS22068.1 hypothetical protein CTHT_0039530 [Thermochaetoides thermophila DSM 1495]